MTELEDRASDPFLCVCVCLFSLHVFREINKPLVARRLSDRPEQSTTMPLSELE